MGIGECPCGRNFQSLEFYVRSPSPASELELKIQREIAGEGGLGTVLGPISVQRLYQQQLLPHPMPADTHQDLLDPMSGESAYQLLSGSSFQVGWDHRGRNEELLQPRLEVEGFLEEAHEGKADDAVMTCQNFPANSAGPLLFPATAASKAARSQKLVDSTLFSHF